MEDATIEVAIDNLSHIGPEKAILLGKALIIDLLQRLKLILNTLIIYYRTDRSNGKSQTSPIKGPTVRVRKI